MSMEADRVYQGHRLCLSDGLVVIPCRSLPTSDIGIINPLNLALTSAKHSHTNKIANFWQKIREPSIDGPHFAIFG